MTFRWPELLVLLVLVPVVVAGYIQSQRWRARRSARLATQGLVTSTAGGRQRARRHLPFALFTAALALLVVALARPSATVDTVQRTATVVLAFDVSNSMGATDVKPSRLAAAKTVGDTFVREQPSGVRIGVVAFGNSSVIVQRVTSNHGEVLQAIGHLTLGGGTAISEGILTSLNAIAGKTLRINQSALGTENGQVHIGYYSGSTIVLLSDGEDMTQNGPEPMARVASVAGVRIQTVGIGTRGGSTVKVDGFSIATALNSPLLQSIAKVTDGSYHQAADASSAQAISKTINLHFAVKKTYTEITAIFAAAAALLLVAGAMVSLAWSGRVI
jgi:Ca-activated chloride channel family protein